MELLLGTSLAAAFIAGLAALFAPCCITVLLPSYLASVFREKSKVFLMTFIFFLGIAAVFVPIGLGVAALGQAFSRYHNTIFAVGGIFLFLLGIGLLAGKSFSLPFKIHPALKKHNAFSVFVLGVFSAIATTCCAPVLAGVLAMAALPGSVGWGAVYALSYVLGMVSPLFFIAAFLDKFDFTGKLAGFQKSLEYSLGGRTVRITIAELIAGAVFTAMGGLTIWLAFANKLFAHSAYQVSVNIYLTRFLNLAGRFINFVPEYVWAAAVVLAVGWIIKLSVGRFRQEK